MFKYLLVALVAMTLAAPAVAHEGHKHKSVKAHASGDWSCSKWAGSDPAHPNAPGSYRSYGCDNTGGDWAWVVGTGYSGTMHVSKLHRICINNHWWGCETWAVYNEQHTHS